MLAMMNALLHPGFSWSIDTSSRLLHCYDQRSSEFFFCGLQLSSFGLAKWAPKRPIYIHCNDAVGTPG